MNIRYQADADLNQAIVTGVLRRKPTIDFQTAFAAGLEGVKDPEVLAIAAQQGRVRSPFSTKYYPSPITHLPKFSCIAHQTLILYYPAPCASLSPILPFKFKQS